MAYLATAAILRGRLWTRLAALASDGHSCATCDHHRSAAGGRSICTAVPPVPRVLSDVSIAPCSLYEHDGQGVHDLAVEGAER